MDSGPHASTTAPGNPALPSGRARPAAPAIATGPALPRARAETAGREAPPTLTIARALVAMILVALAVLFLWLTIQVDLVIFAGVLLAICLRRVAERLGRLTGLPVGWTLALTILLIALVLAGIGWFFSQQIASQMEQLSTQLPAAFAKVVTGFRHSGLGRMMSAHLSTGGLKTSPTKVAAGLFGVATNAVEVAAGVIVMLFLGIYFAAEAPRYAAGLVRLAPPARRPRAAEILHETANAVWYWMLGRLFSMTVLGLLTMVGLWALGVPLPFALGFLAGIMIFVPYVGSIASAVPSVLIAAATRLDLALYVIALYIAIHLIEGYVLVPLVQRRIVHLPPALTLSAQVVLAVIAGFLGLLFATPLVAAALVLIRMIYIEDVLGDRAASASAPAGHGPPQAG